MSADRVTGEGKGHLLPNPRGPAHWPGPPPVAPPTHQGPLLWPRPLAWAPSCGPAHPPGPSHVTLSLLCPVLSLGCTNQPSS